MKKAILLAALVSTGAAVQAQDSSYSVTVDFPYVTKYVFRGAELAEDSIQPSIELAVGDFYAGVWTNNPVVKKDGAAYDNEVDFYAGYGIPLNDTWKLDIGGTYYYYPETSSDDLEDQVEPFVGLNGSIGSFSTSIYGYYEFEYEIWTTAATVGYSFPLEAIGASLDVTGTLGYSSYKDSEEYFYYGVGVAVPFQLTDSASIRVGADWVDNDNHDFVGNDDVIWFTAGLSVGF